MQSKDHVFQSRACAEAIKLRKLQAELEQETGQACFVGLSLAQTGIVLVQGEEFRVESVYACFTTLVFTEHSWEHGEGHLVHVKG